MRIAIAHDWILGMAGTERVLKALHETFPEAPIYTLLYDKKFTDTFLPEARIIGSHFQAAFEKGFPKKILLPFLPLAVEGLELKDYDVVISSSFTYTKGLVLNSKTLHIDYCHSPTRQLWDWQIEHRNEIRMPVVISGFLQHLGRLWDSSAAQRPDAYIANSETVRARIAKYYRKPSEVIYPPVELGTPSTTSKGYFLIVSRLFKQKNLNIAVQAFNKMGWPLVVIGDGPELKRLKKSAQPNIQLLGYQSDEAVKKYYAECKAFIMPQEEDFGITAIEAMSYGKPVLALRRGGATEYIQEGINGEFFDYTIEEALAYGLKRLNDTIEAGKYDPHTISASVQKFSEERFKKEIKEYIEKKKGAHA